MSLPSICIVLIHNNDAERLEHVRPRIHRLADAIGGSVVEISEQPDFEPNSRWLTCRWYVVRQIIERRGAIFLDRPTSDLYRFLRRTLKTVVRIMLPTRTSETLRQLSGRRMLVPHKHFEAWRRYGNAYDYLLVMEDDVVFRGDSMDAFAKFLPILQSLPEDEFAYVDLAGGFAFEDIGLSGWMAGKNGSLVTFSKPATNTVCCYALNAKLANRLAIESERRPGLRTLDADWFINAVMMRLADGPIKFNCLHASPTIFDHGSFTGNYASSLSD